MLSTVKKQLHQVSSKKVAEQCKWFFKTGPGEYGEGDQFIGVRAAPLKKVAKNARTLKLSDVQKLLKSKIHEERTCALLILIHQFQKGDEALQKKIYDIYLKHTKYINGWDLVDMSAAQIVGAYLFDRSKQPLIKLAKSKSLWERRIAIIATFYNIRQHQFQETLKIAKCLLKDKHDLIHKAVGWLLREIGKRDLACEEKFLKQYYKTMPRTMLRYAIERFPEPKRKKYLIGTM